MTDLFAQALGATSSVAEVKKEVKKAREIIEVGSLLQTAEL